MEQMRHWRVYRRMSLFQLPTPQMQERLLQVCTSIYNHYKDHYTPYIISYEGSVLGQDHRSQGFTFLLTTRFASIEAMNIFDQDCATHGRLLRMVAEWGVPPPLVVYGEEEWLPPIWLPGTTPYSGNPSIGRGRGVGTFSAPVPGPVNVPSSGNIGPVNAPSCGNIRPVNAPSSGNIRPATVPPLGNVGPRDVPSFSNFDITGGGRAGTRRVNNPSPRNVGPRNEPSPGHVEPINEPLPRSIGPLGAQSSTNFDITSGYGDRPLHPSSVRTLNEPSSGNLIVAAGRGAGMPRSPISGSQSVPAPSGFIAAGRRAAVAYPGPLPAAPSGPSSGNYYVEVGRGANTGAGLGTGTAAGLGIYTTAGPGTSAATSPSNRSGGARSTGTGGGRSTGLGGGHPADLTGGSSTSLKRRRITGSEDEEVEEYN